MRPLPPRPRPSAAGGSTGRVLTEAAVAELFARHHGELYRYAARFTGEPDLAEDVVQESFVRLVERPAPAHGELRAWLFTVATRVAIDALRERTRHAGLLARTSPEELLPSVVPDPAAAAEREDLADRVRAALATLTERDREVLLMREEGFRHREIAEAIGTTTKSVGTMIARALERLALKLELDVEAVR